MIEATSFSPDWVSAPGDTIEDIMEEQGWSQSELATRLGFTRKHVNRLIHGEASITADTASRLARVLGSTAGFWLVREAQYRAAVEREDATEELEGSVNWLDELPVAWMARAGLISKTRKRPQRVAECLTFFGVASVDAWRAQYAQPLVAFRSSEKFEKKLGAVAAWLRLCEREATSIRCAPYDRAGFKTALTQIRELTLEPNPEVFLPRLVSLCSAHGVAVVLVDFPPGCPVSGATKWLSRDKAMLALSLRHKSNDHLWFSFFHEAGHILLHGKRMQFIEGLDGLDATKESEADEFARDFLIPPTHRNVLVRLTSGRLPTKAAIRSLAASIGVAPGILVGRLQKEEMVPWSHYNDLKVRYKWARH